MSPPEALVTIAPTPRPQAEGPMPALDRPDESDLIARLQAHDPRAYEEVVRAYSGRLLAVIRGIVKNEDDAKECLQETYLQAFRAIERFEGRALLSSWLHRIAVNAALMRLRTRRRKAEAAIDDLLPYFDGNDVRIDPAWQPQVTEGPDLEEKDRKTLIHEAISQLPENYRNVILLRDIQEMSTEEAAEALGITPGAVKVRLHRARMALKTLLDPFAEEL